MLSSHDYRCHRLIHSSPSQRLAWILHFSPTLLTTGLGGGFTVVDLAIRAGFILPGGAWGGPGWFAGADSDPIHLNESEEPNLGWGTGR